MDRWCVTAALGIAAFGQYAFAAFVVAAGMLCYTAVWSHLGPSASQIYGRSGELRDAYLSLRKNAFRLAVLLAAFWYPFRLAVDWLVEMFFPEYRVGGQLMTILYWGSAFQVLCLFDWISMAAERTLVLFWLTLAITIVIGSLCLVAIVAHWPLTAFAWIFVLGRALTAGGQFLIAARLSQRRRTAITSGHTGVATSC